MTYEQIESLTVEDCQNRLRQRLGLESPSQEEFEAELALYKEELVEIEDARIALAELQERIDELGDIAELIHAYFQDNSEELSGNDNWNPAAFSVENIETPSCGFWRFASLAKPSLAQLEEIKENL